MLFLAKFVEFLQEFEQKFIEFLQEFEQKFVDILQLYLCISLKTCNFATD